MVTTEELQRVAALAGLPAEELSWLAARCREVRLERGDAYFEQGEAATRMEIYLEGSVRIVRRDGGKEVGGFTIEAGEVSGRLPFSRMRVYGGNGRATEPTRVAELEVEHFAEMTRLAPETVERLVNVMLDRTREFTRLGEQRERLISLGTMAAGLAHELNNPASAARRAAHALTETLQSFDELSSSLLRDTMIAPGAPVRDAEDLFQPIYDAMVTDLDLGPIVQGDLEDELTDWLAELGVARPWEVGATLVSTGYSRGLLEDFSHRLRPERVPDFLSWLRQDVELRLLAGELVESTGRISELVAAMKAYSYMDQSLQREDTDLHAGLNDTLTILRYKLKRKAITVTKRYGEIPRVPAYGGELNQVWTNLLDNAIAAVDDGGTITIATRRDPLAEVVCVEIIDDGPGIPAEIRARIFEPFFTTKGVGEGTGMGLDIANRIVSKRHRGTLEVESVPGRTCFVARLPLG